MTDTKNEFKGVGQITLNKKKYTYHLNNNALRLMCKALGKSITEIALIMQNDPLEAVPQFIYSGIVNHQARKGEKFEMDFDQFAAFFGDVWDNEDQMAQVNDVISNAWSLNDPDESEQKAAVGLVKP